MTRRLWLHLIGEPDPYVRRSPTGRMNELVRGAWASYYADRALLLITLPWLVLRYQEWTRIQLRPPEIYAPRMWMSELIFPAPPSSAIFYFLLGVSACLIVVCLIKTDSIIARLCLAISVLLVSVPGQGFGHVEHTAHLLLLAHVYSVFRPIRRPKNDADVDSLSRGYAWFLLGLLAIYTASGLWKIVDMTIRDVLKPGVSWLDNEGMVATSVASMRGADLPLDIPMLAESIAWVFPVGYVILTIIFSASFIGAFRRPFLFIVVPTIAAFHVMNAVVMYVLFVFTIFVAILVLWPYGYSLPHIKNQLVRVTDTSFEGSGHLARVVVRYADGQEDSFESFYAYRERLRHKSPVLASLLYFPGIDLLITWGLKRLQKTRVETRS